MTKAKPSALSIQLELSILLVTMLVMSSASSVSSVRIFGIPGTIIDRTLLQVGPGWRDAVITTLLPKTSVQVMCRTQDALVGDDPWWLKVHVWESGREGWVSDYFVQCRQSGNCRVPFCV